MDYDRIQESIIPHILAALKDRDFNWDSVKVAAESAGADYGLVRLAFKDSLDVVLETLATHLNDQVTCVVEKEDLSSLRTHEKIRRIIEVRFVVLEPHRHALRSLAKWDLFLKHFLTGCRLLYETVNKIWYKAGDQSTDYNFYTKRFLLTAVYAPTFISWVQGEATLEDTMALLDERMARVMKIPKIKNQIIQAIRGVLPF